MADRDRRQDATLLDILIDGFEKNEVMRSFHRRELPMPDEAAAVRKFTALSDEAKRWKGAPLKFDDTNARRLAAWPDLEILQAGNGIMLRARAAAFDQWWHEATTWAGDPMRQIYDWIENRGVARRLTPRP
jgi:hypothetical protein